MEEIYILDSVNYIFRSYYGIGPMTNNAGESTSALYGFIRSVNKLRRDFAPKYLICVFDGPDNKKSRQAIYADYKMNRKKAPEDLYPQIAWAYQYCQMAGIPCISVSGVEADDTMASVGQWAENVGMKVFLCTSDKDLCQMVNKTTSLLNVHKENLLMDPSKVEEKFGVKPEQMLDFLAIAGDKSDNIPGIEGFGPKTASSLLQQFGTLENILANPDKVKGEKKQKALVEQKDMALLSKKLATLDYSVIVPDTKEGYQIKEPDIAALEDFFHRMKFTTLLKNLKETQKSPDIAAKHPAPTQETETSKTAEELAPVTAKEEKVFYHLIDSESGLEDLLKKLSKEKEICVDTETTAIHPLLAELVGVGLGVKPGEAFYIPFNSSLSKDSAKAFLEKVFTKNSHHSFYGHNLKYDYHILKNIGIEIPNICFDTILASYILTPQNRRHGLDQVTLEEFGKTKTSYKSLTQEGKTKITLKEVDVEKVSEYCCEDVDYTCRLKKVFQKRLFASKELAKVFTDIELPLLPVLANMERKGIYIDASILEKLSVVFTKELKSLEQEIYKECNKEFNINSPKQLGQVLYEDLHLPLPRKKGSSYSTAADILEKLSELSPVVEKVLQYRGLQKLLSTYVDALPNYINPQTGRIHASFNQSATATGRLSCQDPNLQNIPIRTEAGRKIRKAFMPQKEGWSFLSADYSQIELRLLAHFSEDPGLIKAFKNGEDIHRSTAAKVFNVPLAEVTKEQRSSAKAVNFGILYGQGPYGLSKQIHVSPKEASKFIESYFAQFPKISEFISHCKELAHKTGVTKTLLGRERPIPEIHNKNPALKNLAERLAVNTPLQGTAADLIKMSMIEVDKEIKAQKLDGYMILQIHDELIFEIPDEQIFQFKILVQEKMENALTLKVPLVVDMEVGKNWEEC